MVFSGAFFSYIGVVGLAVASFPKPNRDWLFPVPFFFTLRLTKDTTRCN